MSNELHVLYFSSDLFVDVAATSIVSLLENNKSFEVIKVYVIDDGISNEKCKLLRKMVEDYGRELVLLPAPDPREFFKFPFKSRYQMGHSYMRMCIGSVVPQNVNRLLCLDSDTLVLGDLQEFWNMDMADNVLAGVADCVNVKAFKRQFMLMPHHIYCNAGMFLVNLVEWRKRKIEVCIRDVIHEHNGNIFFFEQTLMNYVCRDKIIKLHPKYNSYTLFFAFKYANLLRWRKPTCFYDEKEVKEAVTNPQIIHFTRNFYMMSRPWVKGCDHPMTSTYLKYKQLTPWKKLGDDNRSLYKKVRYKVIHYIPQSLLAIIVNIMYNTIRPLLIWKNE